MRYNYKLFQSAVLVEIVKGSIRLITIQVNLFHAVSDKTFTMQCCPWATGSDLFVWDSSLKILLGLEYHQV